jgi:hypothetical protein
MALKSALPEAPRPGAAEERLRFIEAGAGLMRAMLATFPHSDPLWQRIESLYLTAPEVGFTDEDLLSACGEAWCAEWDACVAASRRRVV